MRARVEHPTLYKEATPAPLMLASRCAECGRVSFPRQSFGCEECGAHGEEMAPVEIEANGVLISYAVVRKHTGVDVAAPYAMGEIRLNAGPVIRCTLIDGLKEAALHIGQSMSGALIHNPKSAPDVVELRFAPVNR